MNEDEAFIRAIVDSPGDDTPRLVYADWLDDCDDPRGPYLRAECEAVGRNRKVRRADTNRIRSLADGLDPLWTARVSRPPVGACCDHIQFEQPGPVITQNDLRSAGLIPYRPPDYLAFLLNHNGGCPVPSRVRPSNGQEWDIERLYQLDLVKFCPTSETQPAFLLLGETSHVQHPTGTFFMTCSGSERGCVWIEYHDFTLERGTYTDQSKLAASFATFLSMIE